MNRRTITVSIPGEPVGKGRARHSARNGFVRTYTPEKTRTYESRVADAARAALDGAEPMTGPLDAHVRVCVGVPASTTRRRREAMLAGTIYPTKVPDLDNIIKGVLDGCNKVAFADDKQIVDLNSTKRYGPVPGVTLTIKEIAA